MARPILPSFFGDEMAQQLDQRDIVIKVKYGDTLRRIGACVHGKLMDHNMSKLRAKIISLFNFSHDADLILTYTDEDGDVVTLDNDDELHDAVIGQHLNPLRINVQLKSTGTSHAKLETSSSAKPCVDEPLKSIPEPIVSALSKVFTVAQEAVSTSPVFDAVNSEPFKNAIEHLSKDVKKVASFSPALAQVVEQFSKLGSSNVSPPSGPTTDSSGGPSGASTHLVDLIVADDPKAPNEPILETTELPSNIPISSSTVNNIDTPRNATQSLYPLEELLDSIWASNKSSEHEKEAGRNLDGKSFGAAISAFSPINQGPNTLKNFWSPLTTEPRAFPPSLSGFNPHSEFILPISQAMMHPYRRSHSHSENTSRTFHMGVQCDGCGMHPIVGPRFKSNA